MKNKLAHSLIFIQQSYWNITIIDTRLSFRSLQCIHLLNRHMTCTFSFRHRLIENFFCFLLLLHNSNWQIPINFPAKEKNFNHNNRLSHWKLTTIQFYWQYLLPINIYIYVVPLISFQTVFVLAFKIVVDSWKFSMLLLYILWDDWPIFMISASNE